MNSNFHNIFFQNQNLATYRGFPHKTVKWETENTVLCEIVLFQIENRDIAKNSTM